MRIMDDIRSSYKIALKNTPLSNGWQEAVLNTVDDYIDNNYTEDVQVGIDIDGVPILGIATLSPIYNTKNGPVSDIIIELSGLNSILADRVLRLISEEYAKSNVEI